MSQFFPWKKNDPFDRRRQELADETAAIEARAQELQDEMARLSRPEDEAASPRNPVWKADPSEGRPHRHPSPRTPRPERQLKAHRRRDRNLVITLTVLAILIVTWIIFH